VSDDLERCARDFGGLVSARPAEVRRAADYDAVARAVRFARERRLEVVARGQAHTTRGQSLSRGGLVIDTAALDRVLDVDAGAGAARVQAGARWRELLAATLAAGLAPPVLTDYLDLSIAGTLSVGGVGGTSFRHGLQLDNVRALSVVTAVGELVRCSPEREPALFDACRGGLGQFGVIVEAELALVPAAPRVRVFELDYPSLPAFLRAQHELAEDGRFDYLVGNFRRDAASWRFSLECVRFGGDESDARLLGGLDFTGEPARRELGYSDYANRLAAMVSAMQRAGTWHALHPWIDLFLPASRAEPVIAAALDDVTTDELGDGYVMTYPLLARNCRSPFPGLPDDARLFLFDVLPSIPEARARLLPTFLDKCERLLIAARAIGGTVYPIGFPIGSQHMQPADWQRQLGARAAALERCKREFDPDRIFNPTLGMFE